MKSYAVIAISIISGNTEFKSILDRRELIRVSVRTTVLISIVQLLLPVTGIQRRMPLWAKSVWTLVVAGLPNIGSLLQKFGLSFPTYRLFSSSYTRIFLQGSDTHTERIVFSKNKWFIYVWFLCDNSLYFLQSVHTIFGTGINMKLMYKNNQFRLLHDEDSRSLRLGRTRITIVLEDDIICEEQVDNFIETANRYVEEVFFQGIIKLKKPHFVAFQAHGNRHKGYYVHSIDYL